jgi:hypothetical protein
LDEKTYYSELARLEALLVESPPSSTKILDGTKATTLLGEMPKLLREATAEQRRVLVQLVLRQVWIECGPKPDAEIWVKAIAPTKTYEVLVGAIITSSNFAMATSAGLEPTTFSSGG